MAPERSLGDAIRSRDNAFDLLRLLSCATVVFSHSFALTGRIDPLDGLLGFQLGTIGVFMLFSLSGYLLAASLGADRRPGPFWIRRMLRLAPALVMSALLTALVLGPLVTDLTAGHYLTSAGPYEYVIKQSVFDTFRPHLPGVFIHNPLPSVVNGSLWTLPLEVCCYAALTVAGAIGVLRRSRILVGVVFGVCLAMLVVAPPDSPRGISPHGVELIANALRPCGAFACGVLLWTERDRIPRSGWLVALAALSILAPLPSGARSAIDLIAVPYLVVVIGSRRPGRLHKLIALGDVSYGVYIYSFPIQQVLAQYIAGITPVGMLALSTPASWVLGLASWHLIERHALGWRRRFIRPAPAEPRPAYAASR
jgi:peptidoglycan/LPS O-acetylase OafA/YrhL